MLEVPKQNLQQFAMMQLKLCLQGREDEYTYQFTQDDITELTAAVSKVKASGVSTERQISAGVIHFTCGLIIH